MKKLTVALMGLCAALLFAVFAVGPARIAAAAVNMSTVAASGNYLATAAGPTSGFMSGPFAAKLDALPSNATLTTNLGLKANTTDLYDPFKSFWFVEEFVNNPSTTIGQLVSNVTGTGAAVAATATGADGTHRGIWNLTTGTTATGRASVLPTANPAGIAYNFTAGASTVEWMVRLSQVQAAATQEFVVETGVLATLTQPTTDGVYFRFDASSANWQVCTAASSSRTCTATSVAAAAGQWVRLSAIKAAGSSDWSFSIDGTSTGITNSTNVPSAALQVIFNIISTVGTGAKQAQIDIASVRQFFSPDRGL